jgi:hypothetical protein
MAIMPDPYSLRHRHPAVREYGYEKTSDKDAGYNCVAWAAGMTTCHWWPLEVLADDCYWPPDAPCLDESIATFVAAFATLGYEPCQDGTLEKGYEKVAIYAKAGAVVHMARQLEDGRWTSKWGGMGIDFVHCVEALEDSAKFGKSDYGKVAQYLRRKK